MLEVPAEVAVLEALEVTLRNALVALRGPAHVVVGRRSQPGPGCRVSVTSLEAVAIHLAHVVAALAELRATLEHGTGLQIVAKRSRRTEQSSNHT